jgi:hypothetical protein
MKSGNKVHKKYEINKHTETLEKQIRRQTVYNVCVTIQICVCLQSESYELGLAEGICEIVIFRNVAEEGQSKYAFLH